MKIEQQKRFDKVNTEIFYLVDKAETDSIYKFTVTGSTANIYNVTIIKNTSSIKCDCPDGLSWANKYNCICKHACFILEKVVKCFKYIKGEVYNRDLEPTKFFDKLEFSQAEMQYIKDFFAKIDMNTGEYISKKYVDKYNKLDKLSSDLFNHKTKPIIDDCPICFDSLKTTDEPLSCPICSNYIHKQCMEKWLGVNNTCVYCRSDIWNKYKNKPGKYANLK